MPKKRKKKRFNVAHGNLSLPVRTQESPGSLPALTRLLVLEAFRLGEFEYLFAKLPSFRRLAFRIWASMPTAPQPSLERWLLSGSTELKTWAAQVLVARHEDGSNAVLLKAASSEDPAVRKAVIGSLRGGRASFSVPLLVAAEADPDLQVRQLALGVQLCFPHEVQIFKRQQQRRRPAGPGSKRVWVHRSLLTVRRIADRDEQYPK